ncbi:MAG TPA: glycosyltransferase family 9 protein, partial [Chlorobaculum sp.]|nr:glycosyltransferase family 9 protein [Chlorobaculum sp.]
PGGKWKPRRWPFERFLEVARLAVSRWDVSCEFLINESEEDLRYFFQEHNHDEKISVRLTRNASDLLDAVSTCSILVGNDSGPVHLGNLMNKETVVVWGPGNYERIRPIGDNVIVLKHEIDCRPCRQYRHGDRCERGENVCLLSIGVEEVLSAIEDKICKKKMA